MSPYIKKELREKIDNSIDDLIEGIRDTDIDGCPDGIINYAFTRILKNFYSGKYHKYNSAIGVLECVKQEFYRTSVAPYEEKKRNENGDVK